FFFFFQAEDGIRDRTVTGVQTCALPIYQGRRISFFRRIRLSKLNTAGRTVLIHDMKKLRRGCLLSIPACGSMIPRNFCSTWRRRSEERRVGKECRSRGQTVLSSKTEVER